MTAFNQRQHKWEVRKRSFLSASFGHRTAFCWVTGWRACMLWFCPENVKSCLGYTTDVWAINVFPLSSSSSVFLKISSKNICKRDSFFIFTRFYSLYPLGGVALANAIWNQWAVYSHQNHQQRCWLAGCLFWRVCHGCVWFRCALNSVQVHMLWRWSLSSCRSELGKAEYRWTLVISSSHTFCGKCYTCCWRIRIHWWELIELFFKPIPQHLVPAILIAGNGPLF